MTEVLSDLGLKLNSGKTTTAQPVVENAIKMDKLAWMRGRQRDPSLQKHLLILHAHGVNYPNAGSLEKALINFYERLNKSLKIRNPIQMISIAVDIGCRNPRCFPLCTAIVSKLLSILKTKDERIRVLARIQAKLAQLPNTGHLEIWIQRISQPIQPKIEYKEALCKLVGGEKVKVWNNDWISSDLLKKAINPINIIDKSKLKSLGKIVKLKEIKLFKY